MFSEVLRLHPPFPSTAFWVIKEEGVTVGGYNLEKGTKPIINVTAIHRNPKYWIIHHNPEMLENVDMSAVHLEFWMNDEGDFVKKLQSGSCALWNEHGHTIE